MIFSANGLTAVPVEMARGARRRGLKVIAVTGVQQSLGGEPDPAVGGRLLDEADLVIDLCTPEADAMVLVPGLDTPVGPGSTLAYVAIVNSLKVRIAQLLTEQGMQATGHHARLRGGRGALAGALRERLSGTRATCRADDRPRARRRTRSSTIGGGAQRGRPRHRPPDLDRTPSASARSHVIFM